MYLYYDIAFFLSLSLTLVYAAMWHKHFNVHFTLIFTLIPISNLGYVIESHAGTLDGAVAGLKIIYLGGCFMVLFLLQSVLGMCHIKVPRNLDVAMLSVNNLLYLSVLTIGNSDIFYKSCTMAVDGTGMTYITEKEYGLMHTVFFVVICLYFFISIAALIYCYFKKKSVSRKMIYLLLLPEIVVLLSYFIGQKLLNGLEIVPAAYIFAQVMYLRIVKRLCMYDVTDSAIDSLVQAGNTGFVSFDFRFNYLGSNGTARRIFPELDEVTVDKTVSSDLAIHDIFEEWLSCFVKDENNDKFYWKSGENTYLIDVNHLFDGKRKIGYQFLVTDDTKNQQYISLINRYNSDLKEEVEEKTAHIEEMHDKLILGMAVMVESRDNSTGGHIRRTSDCIRILIGKIRQTGVYELDDEFCKRLIKAAPMHDLGKIAVDDKILRKPGRFEPEEFEQMKTHAAKGAELVDKILEGTDDDMFRSIAVNVAHYHHERMDGTGYPEGLSGSEIPLEARIMAIVDVYDALVSKRCYKESMPFDKAFAIIDEGMGTQFDPELRESFHLARPELEAYYS